MPNNTPVVEHDELLFYGPLADNFSWPSGWYYVDASGGKYSSIPLLRRCGVGVAFLHEFPCIDFLQDPDDALAFGISAPLPGVVQTVQRAELYAILIVIKNAVPNND